MKTSYRGALVAMLVVAWSTAGPLRGSETRFTPLVRLPAPKIIDCATPWPGGADEVEFILDDNPGTRYASHSKGTDTFIDFDFSKPVAIAGFRHVDRRNRANVDAAELIFSSDPKFGEVVERVTVKHQGVPLGVTHAAFGPVTARYLRWKVTAFSQLAELGGTSIQFFTPSEAHAQPDKLDLKLTAVQVLTGAEGKRLQPLRATIQYPYLETREATLEIAGQPPRKVPLRFGEKVLDLPIAAVATDTAMDVALMLDTKATVRRSITLKPVRPWIVYLLPHSHVDVGYTHVQTDVMKRQWEHLELAIDLARRTADYPSGAQFKWNCEVLWAVDQYLEKASPQKRKAFLDAVRKGRLHLDGLYGNQLTGLCRPEELFRWMAPARRIARQHGVTIDSAMISDVPGYTWGIVPAMARSGIKYLSMGPNGGHRIGHTRRAWSDKPFYWKSPDGRDRVLCWMAGKGYSWFLSDPGLNAERFVQYVTQLESAGYPYDLVQVRYSIGADNGPPDPRLPGFVKDFNAKHVAPKLMIATTREMFREFEQRYGDKVPEVSGDFTPYWEDGAASSARETALARNAAERLVQAETLWALLCPQDDPVGRFDSAWRNVLLYNEHTWGAHCSISSPDDPFTLAQWKIKQAFATDANAQSVDLLEAALAGHRQTGGKATAVDVFNTASWPRSGLIELPSDVAVAGDVIHEDEGRPVPSQRSGAGRLWFVARDVPPLGAKRFHFRPGMAQPAGRVRAEGNVLSGPGLRLTVDESTGAICSLVCGANGVELVDRDSGMALNEYLYVAGRDPKDPKRNAPVTVKVGEPGPLAASIVVESLAPGCRKLTREIRLVDGLDHVAIRNVIDKEPIRQKEGVYFGYAFRVPEGVVRMNTPWAVVRPEKDQLPGACKNYFTVGRWLDISNDRGGLTWTTVDAPMVQLGTIRTDVLPNPFDPARWLEHLEPSQIVYSYVMNNYWETNYKADQDGPTLFRYAIRVHGGYDQVAAQRFGIEQSQPLVTVPVDPDAPRCDSRLTIEPHSVMATMLKSDDDGKVWTARLFNAGDQTAKATVNWSDPKPRQVTISNPFGDEGAPVTGLIHLPPLGIVTLRARWVK